MKLKRINEDPFHDVQVGKVKHLQIIDVPRSIGKSIMDRYSNDWIVLTDLVQKAQPIKINQVPVSFEPIKFNESTSIIILTVNKLDLLKKCLDSIHKYTNNYELVIIGNNPTDEVRNYLESLDKFDLKLVINKENKGYPYGCNQGIKLVKYDYICFLNDDTVVTPNWLYKLQKAFKVKKDCSFASPTTCFSSGKQCDWNLAKDRFSMNEAEILDYSNKLKEDYIQTEVYGFCILTKKEILNKIGVFDWHRYGLGSAEEVDLQWRAEKFGYKSYWAKQSYVHHYGHVTMEKLGDNYLDRYRKNKTIFEERKKEGKDLFVENDVEIGNVKEVKFKKDKKISVVIPVLNRKEETIKTLKSLFENNSDIDVLVIDNGSEDINYMKNFKVKILKNKNNLGTIKATNQGLKFFQSKYIVIMHNDIVIHTKNWIDKTISFMEGNKDVGMVGIAGWRVIRNNGLSNTLITAIDKYNKNPKDFAEVSVLDGSCNIIRNLDLRFDEAYGLMHCYDLDLSMQYRQRGYKLFVMHGSAEHFAENSKKSTRASEKYLKEIGMKDDQYRAKNKRIFLDKWKNYLPITVPVTV